MRDIYDIETDSFSLLAKDEVPNRPLSVCLRLYYHCNLYCPYCLSESLPTKSKRVSSNVEYVIEAISEKGALRLIWSGGEPLLYKKLPQLLFHSHKIGNINIVATNGTIMPSQECIEYSDWFQISCPSTNLKIYEEMRQNKDLALVLKNAEKLVQNGIKVSIFIPLSTLNLSTALQTIKDWISVGIRKFTISRILPLGRAINCGFSGPSDEEIIELKYKIHELNNIKNVHFTCPAIKKQKEQESGYIIIDSNGELISPHISPKANLLINRVYFWRNLQNFYKYHWVLFRGYGH